MGCQGPPQTHKIISPRVSKAQASAAVSESSEHPMCLKPEHLSWTSQKQSLRFLSCEFKCRSQSIFCSFLNLDKADITPCHTHQGPATLSFTLTLHKGTEVNQVSREIVSDCGKAKESEIPAYESAQRSLAAHHVPIKQEASVPEKMFSQDVLEFTGEFCEVSVNKITGGVKCGTANR